MTRRSISTEQDLSRAERDELRRTRMGVNSDEVARQEPEPLATPSLPAYHDPEQNAHEATMRHEALLHEQSAQALPVANDPGYRQPAAPAAEEPVVVQVVDDFDLAMAPPSVQAEAGPHRLQARRIEQGIYFVVHTIAILLGIRLLLGLFGANPENSFVIFIGTLAWPFAAPFENLFSLAPGLAESGFDLGVLFGIFIYYLFAWIIVRAVRFAMMRPIMTK